MNSQNSVWPKVDIYRWKVDIFALVLCCSTGVERVDLRNIWNRSSPRAIDHLPSWTFLRMFAVTWIVNTSAMFAKGSTVTCFRCWSSSLEPSYRSRRERFSILACKIDQYSFWISISSCLRRALSLASCFSSFFTSTRDALKTHVR